MFTLANLPYTYSALEPFIDELTMKIHHDKHHNAYIENLNKALSTYPELSNKSIEELLKDISSLPADIQASVKNNGGGHYNHSLFWGYMSDKHHQVPSRNLAKKIDEAFGDIDKFKEAFASAGLSRFGSGWVWLVKNGSDLEIISTANQDTPISEGKTPLLGLDVWEHAYYLKYQNKRIEYIQNWWHVVNWDSITI
ncbi:MAG: superoxide dismutase [Candidatus Roizmanbacteria bacterium]